MRTKNSLHVDVLKIENEPKNNNFGNKKTIICTLI